MNLMNLFGKANATKSTPKEAIVRLRENLDMLDKREKFLQQKSDNELLLAKQNASTNKRVFHYYLFIYIGLFYCLLFFIVALMALKRKKAYEEQINKIMGSRMTLETQVMAIESANINLETMNAMRAGADAMKTIHGSLDVNKVDQTMDEIREQMDLANEISDAISQPVNLGLELDEDELNAELELLEQVDSTIHFIQEELDTKLLHTGLGTDLNKAPSVPLTVPAIAQPPRPVRQQIVDDDEDAELAELKASMAL